MAKIKMTEPSLDLSLSKALNGYKWVASKDDAKEWLERYFRNDPDKYEIVYRTTKTNIVSTYGFIARLLERGYPDTMGLKERLEGYIDVLRHTKPSNDDETPVLPVLKKKEYDITPFLELIDHKIDDFLTNDAKFDINKEIILYRVPKNQYSAIEEEYRKYQDIDATKEEYSFVSKKKWDVLRKNLLVNPDVISTPKRKRKIDPHKAIEKLNFLAKNLDYNLESIHPVHIIGAGVLIVFDVSKKLATVFKAKDTSGLGVSGSRITNYNEKLASKKIRKEEDVANMVNLDSLSGTIKWLEELPTKEYPIKPLINKNVILLRVF